MKFFPRRRLFTRGALPLLVAMSALASAKADTWVEAVTKSAPKYWYRFEETDPTSPAKSLGSEAGWDGVYGPEITAADNLGKPSATPALGKALELTGPSAGNTTGKFVDLAANASDPTAGIPELINLRPPAEDKTTTVEYWIKSEQKGSTLNQTWTSPALLANESPGDGDMYWGWINDTGDFSFSTSDLVEIFARRDSGREVVNGLWHHIVLVKEWHVSSQGVSTMYIDGGTAQGGATIVMNTGAGSTSYQDSDGGIRYLGFTQNGGGGDVQFIGSVDEVAIYNRGLSADEVAAHYTSVASIDSDGDGIPDLYELGHGLNPNLNDAGLDPDNDGLTNLEEFQKGTDPQNPDTDGDGLKDGVETNTGTWVDATHTGTDPLNPDTDGDGLKDGVETNTGTFVSATNTGTSPLKVDTDGDSYDDAGEIKVGSNPNDKNSLPPAGNWPDAIAKSAPVYWFRFEETNPALPAKNQGSATGMDGAYGDGMTAADNLGKPSVLPVLGKALEFTGPAADNTTTKFVDLAINAADPNAGIPELTNFRPPTVDKTTTVEYWIKTTQKGSAADQTWNSPAVLANESPADGDMYWGYLTDTGDFCFSTSDISEIHAQRDGGKKVSDGQWHHVVLIKEWHATKQCVSTMYLDGGAAQGGKTISKFTAAGTVSYQDTDGGIRYLGFTQHGGTANVQFIGSLDELVIYDRALTETEVRQHFRSVYEADTDGDGMPDAYEISNGLDPTKNDANEDPDGDGLTNLQEYKLGTNPQNPDTDGDGLKDGVETNTGVWVSANDTGTDPFNPDTDGDGIKDGVETNTGTFVDANNTGTSPLSIDSDGDGYRDQDEIALGTNPVDANSKPAVAGSWVAAVTGDKPAYWWRFEGSSVANPVPNEGSIAGFSGTFGPGITDGDLGKASAAPGLGKALELTGPPAGTGTDKFVDFGDDIPELLDLRSAPEDGKATTVEYWLKTTQAGSAASQTWNSPAIFGHESPGDGDMYWGWINQNGDFGFSTSDIVEIFSPGVTDGNWHHIVMTKIWNLSVPSVSRLFIDGGAHQGGRTIETFTSAGAVSLQDDDGGIQFLGFTEGGGSGDLQFIGQIDEVAIYTKPFNEAMARVHYLAAGIAPANFSIVSFAWDPTPRDLTLTWEATSGASYTVQRSPQVVPTAWGDIGQVTATGATASFKDQGRPADAGTWIYRVRRN